MYSYYLISESYYLLLSSWKALGIGRWMTLQLRKLKLLSFLKLEKGGSGQPWVFFFFFFDKLIFWLPWGGELVISA